MCGRKSVGPRLELWGTPALTGYSCKDFPSKTAQSHLLQLIGETEFFQKYSKISGHT